MLDVQGAVDADARVEQLLDVLPALGVARAGGVGVGQLVHQEEAGAARQGGVEVELLQRDAAVLERPLGQRGKTLEERRGLGTAVRLEDADHDVHPLPRTGARRLQHRVRLPHAGRGAEVDPQAPARRTTLLLTHLREESLGVGPAVVHGGYSKAGRQAG